MTTPVKLQTPVGELAGLLDQPTGQSDQEHPALVVLCHGFTGWKEEPHLAALAARLAQLGMAALRCDAPGSGESAGSLALDYRLSRYVSAIQSVVAHAAEQLRLATRPVGIWGHSMGGYVAAHVAATQHVAALCACQPSSGEQQLAEAERQQWQDTGWKRFSNSKFYDFTLPYEFYLDRQRHDLLKLGPQIAIPLLAIVGTRDEQVDNNAIRQFYHGVPEPKQLLEFDTGHSYKSEPPMLSQITDVTAQFFAQYLSNSATDRYVAQ